MKRFAEIVKAFFQTLIEIRSMQVQRRLNSYGYRYWD